MARELPTFRLAVAVFIAIWTVYVYCGANAAARISLPLCALENPLSPAGRDTSAAALSMLHQACPNQPLLCCTHKTERDMHNMIRGTNITAVMDEFFQHQLSEVRGVLRTELYRIGDILVRNIPQEFPMIDPIEMNMLRPNIQDIFCQVSAEFAQEIDEPLCHPHSTDSRTKANFILAGVYTSAAVTAMGFPNRLLTPEAAKCVRAYTTRSYTAYIRHLDSLTCALESLQCQVKPALVALQSAAELFDRVRGLLHSQHFPGPKCKHAVMSISVCPYCSGLHAVPTCLSSCGNVLNTCLEELVDGELERALLPVINDALVRLESTRELIQANLAIARAAIHQVVLEANSDVRDRRYPEQLKDEVTRYCHLGSVLRRHYEPQFCNHVEPLVNYADVFQRAIAGTKALQDGISGINQYYWQELCPKAAVAGSERVCRDNNYRLHPYHQRAVDNDFKQGSKSIMDLFLMRNRHLFDFVPLDEYRLLYDDEDTQGSYLVVSEEAGSGSGSGSGSGESGDGSDAGSGSGKATHFEPVPKIKPFRPHICQAQRQPAPPSPDPVTTQSPTRMHSRRTTIHNSDATSAAATSRLATTKATAESQTEIETTEKVSSKTVPTTARNLNESPELLTRKAPPVSSKAREPHATSPLGTLSRELDDGRNLEKDSKAPAVRSLAALTLAMALLALAVAWQP